MTGQELARVHVQVATIIEMLRGLDLEEAAKLMDAAGKAAKVADPVLWAKAKDAHLRMRALVEATLVYQHTVKRIRKEIPKKRADSPIVLLS